MQFRLFAILLFALTTGRPVVAQAGHFNFSTSCEQAYQATISLKFEEAHAIIAQERKDDPENLIPVFIENYIDFLTVFTTEDRQVFERLEGNKDKRLKLLKKSDKSSPYYLYTQAEITLQWGFTRIRFSEYFTALLEMRKAYKLLQENQQRFPDFVANKKTLGMLHVLLSTIPDKYRWGLRIFGMEGNLEKGKSQLQEILAHSARHHFVFHDETVMLYSALLLLVEKKELEAWHAIQLAGFPKPGNVVSHYAAANIAIFSGRNDEAIKYLTSRPQGNEYQPFPYLDYLTGLAKLRKQDADAHVWFQKFLLEYPGQNHLKNAHQKMAWYSLLHDDMAGYHEHMKWVIKKGVEVIDADKQAMKEALSGEVPNKLLLKVRLLTDGRYFEEANHLIEDIHAHQFSKPRFQIECDYRKGRLLHESGEEQQAIAFYEKTIGLGLSQPYYYAANSALNLAYIFEKRNDYVVARHYFNKCLQTADHEYKNSLDQKAKAGLNRLKGKI